MMMMMVMVMMMMNVNMFEGFLLMSTVILYGATLSLNYKLLLRTYIDVSFHL